MHSGSESPWSAVRFDFSPFMMGSSARKEGTLAAGGRRASFRPPTNSFLQGRMPADSSAGEFKNSNYF
jgi:hypothetical protein